MFENWDELERKRSPLKKFKLIINSLDIAKEISPESEKVIKNLFEHRNSIAHGRTYYSETESFITYDSEKSISEFLKRESKNVLWKKNISEENVNNMLKFIGNLIRIIYSNINQNCEKYPNGDSLGMLFSPFEYIGHGITLKE